MPEPPKFARVNLKGAYPPTETPDKPIKDTIAPAGHCLAPKGAPIADADVVLYHLDWSDRSQRVVERTRSNQQGSFQFALVPVTLERTDEYAVVATAGGRVTAFKRFPSRTTDGKHLELHMLEASELRGQVFGPDGKPVQGAIVWAARPLPQPVLGLQCTTTDENGKFLIDDIATLDRDWSKPVITESGLLLATANSPSATLLPPSGVRLHLAAIRIGPWRGAVRSQARRGHRRTRRLRRFRQTGGWDWSGHSEHSETDYEQVVTDKQGRYRFTCLRAEKYNLWTCSPDWTARRNRLSRSCSRRNQEGPRPDTHSRGNDQRTFRPRCHGKNR